MNRPLDGKKAASSTVIRPEVASRGLKAAMTRKGRIRGQQQMQFREGRPSPSDRARAIAGKAATVTSPDMGRSSSPTTLGTPREMRLPLDMPHRAPAPVLVEHSHDQPPEAVPPEAVSGELRADTEQHSAKKEAIVEGKESTKKSKRRSRFGRLFGGRKGRDDEGLDQPRAIAIEEAVAGIEEAELERNHKQENVAAEERSERPKRQYEQDEEAAGANTDRNRDRDLDRRDRDRGGERQGRREPNATATAIQEATMQGQNTIVAAEPEVEKKAACRDAEADAAGTADATRELEQRIGHTASQHTKMAKPITWDDVIQNTTEIGVNAAADTAAGARSNSSVISDANSVPIFPTSRTSRVLDAGFHSGSGTHSGLDNGTCKRLDAVSGGENDTGSGIGTGTGSESSSWQIVDEVDRDVDAAVGASADTDQPFDRGYAAASASAAPHAHTNSTASTSTVTATTESYGVGVGVDEVDDGEHSQSPIHTHTYTDPAAWLRFPRRSVKLESWRQLAPYLRMVTVRDSASGVGNLLEGEAKAILCDNCSSWRESGHALAAKYCTVCDACLCLECALMLHYNPKAKGHSRVSIKTAVEAQRRLSRLLRASVVLGGVARHRRARRWHTDIVSGRLGRLVRILNGDGDGQGEGKGGSDHLSPSPAPSPYAYGYGGGGGGGGGTGVDADEDIDMGHLSFNVDGTGHDIGDTTDGDFTASADWDVVPAPAGSPTSSPVAPTLALSPGAAAKDNGSGKDEGLMGIVTGLMSWLLFGKGDGEGEGEGEGKTAGSGAAAGGGGADAERDERVVALMAQEWGVDG